MAKRKRKKHLTAATADKYWMYQQSVQAPDAEVSFFHDTFKKRFRRVPTLLREDFCGTAAVCCEWVRSRPDRIAHGFDIDPEPLSWGQENNLTALSPKQRARVTLHQQDVRRVKGPKGDIVAAQNFSYFTFRTRKELCDYFRVARRNLADEGMLVLDIMGGSEVIEEDRSDKRKVDGFRYIWEHRRFDPVTHRCQYDIHFKFRDGSKIERAFSYDWRLWSIPEVRELLDEAKFSESAVFWEGSDEDGEGDGIYTRCESAPSDPAWVSYVVAFK
jgi:hypothetical protein